MEPKKKQTLKEIQKIWYAKLAETGFVDIEAGNQSAYSPFKELNRRRDATQYKQVWRESKLEYYLLAERFCEEYAFETELDRIIWVYHTNLISMRKISELLGQVGFNLGKKAVNTRIQKLKEIMLVMYHIKGPKK